MFPFPIIGIDSDNGSEFINEHLLGYCHAHRITFTRSRPGNKNDGAHVEQKNWARVRELVGYLRYDTPAELAKLNEIWELDRIFTNYLLARTTDVVVSEPGPPSQLAGSGLVPLGRLRVGRHFAVNFLVDAAFHDEGQERDDAAQGNEDELAERPAHQRPQPEVGDQVDHVHPAMDNQHRGGDVEAAGDAVAAVLAAAKPKPWAAPVDASVPPAISTEPKTYRTTSSAHSSSSMEPVRYAITL